MKIWCKMTFNEVVTGQSEIGKTELGGNLGKAKKGCQV